MTKPLIDFDKNKEVRPLEALFQQFSQGVLITDTSGKILKMNQSFELLTLYKSTELVGEYIDSYSFGQPALSFLSPSGSWKGEVVIKKHNGEAHNLWLEVLSYQPHQHQKYYLFLFRGLHPLAYRDPLTNLPNRRCFERCLSKFLHQNTLNQTNFTLLFIDLDRFKKVNDSFGHGYGDELLIQVTTKLQSSLRKNDVLARLGGDEFICLLPHLHDKKEAEKTAQRILDALSEPFMLFEQEVYITASIGICLFPFDGDSIEGLMSNADSAMYRAKKMGKNQFQWYQVELAAGSFELFMLENHLRKALQKSELSLHYQPLMNLETEKVNSVEALLRWEHPEFGFISPQDFIPLAEETGLIIPIGNWVLKQACTQNKQWQSQGYPPVKIAVNLSPKQFLLQNLPEIIKETLLETGLSGCDLIIEITENMIIQDFDTAVSHLNSLKNMGIHISIDDFGTGYSSLNYLSKLPINNVKIDRSFIKDIDQNPKNKVLTQAMVSLAHALELAVVAEGIETTNQLSEVKNMHCDEIQGYLISKPLKPEQVCQYF